MVMNILKMVYILDYYNQKNQVLIMFDLQMMDLEVLSKMENSDNNMIH